MRLRLLCILTCLPALGLGSSWCAAQENGLSARHHPWGHFRPGAWKLVRVVTETLDEHGLPLSTSITETKTSLVKIEDDGVVLEVEVGVEVAGRQFDGTPRCIKQGFHGEMLEPGLKIEPPTAGQLTIEDRPIDCRVQKLEFAGTNNRTATTIFYSDTLMPYVLKRQSVTTDLEGKPLGESSLAVVAVDMPQKVLSEKKSAACIKSVQKQARGTIVTVAMTCGDVPGGLVYHASKETDKTGRVVRRSTLELVGYGLQSEEERSGLFGRKRPPRRKPPYNSPR